MRVSHLVCAAVLLVFPAAAGATPSGPEICEDAAQIASRRTGVPLDVLIAISTIETGRRHEGRVRPWPWAVNLGGEGRWFETRDAAVRFASDARASGRTNIDTGCFQLNFRWHGQAFPSIEAMFDPVANATYAADFLRRLYDEFGDWSRAAGAYHSRTATLAARYRSRFDAVLGRTPHTEPVVVIADATPDRPNLFPLFQTGPRSDDPASLMPQYAPSAPLFPAGGRSVPVIR